MPPFSFLLASSHHHPSMNYHYIFLLLLVVLSAYSESPQHAKLPDPPLIGLLLKQSLFRKHDFAILVHRVYHDYQNLCFWHLNFFSKYRSNSYTHIKEELTEKST